MKKQALLFFALLSVCAFGQGVRWDIPPILNSRAVLVPNANISLCPGTATITNSTCSPASTQAFTDITLTTPCATGSPVVLPQTNVCSGVADSLGNAGFWLAPGAYIYCINGPTITGKCYNLSVPSGTTAGGAATITNAGTFNNTQQLYQSVAINGFNQKAEFNALFAPSAFALEGMSAGATVPGTSTTNQVNGVAGYVIDQRANPVTPSVGVFGVGNAQALNARVWGANFIGTDIGSASASNSIYGGENDCFIGIVASLCRGLLIEAFWLGGIQPSTVYGIEVGQPLGAVSTPHWTFGIRFDLGSTQAVTGSNAAIFFDRSATGNTQRSQGMLFESTNGSGGNPTGFLDMDPSGNLTYVSNVVGTGFQVGSVGINTPSILFNGFTSGTVTHTAPNTITSYTETDPAAAPAVANAVKQYTTGGVASFSASPGTLTIANGTKALNTASITTATCDAGVAATANGTLSTDTVNWSFNSAPTTANKYGAFLVVYAVPSANTVTFYTCNPSATTSTPTAMTVNFNVTR